MSQRSLGNYASGLLARPAQFTIIQRIRAAVTDFARDIGVPIDKWTARPGELDDDAGILRHQYSTVYYYYTRTKDGGTETGKVQLRTTFHTLTSPSDEVTDYIKNENHGRLHTLFETGTYSGFMSGFHFHSKDTNIEKVRTVTPDELPPTGLGVPNFYVEIYDEYGVLQDNARGYSLDFGIHSQQIQTPDAPSQEVWKVGSFNAARGDYQLNPPSNTAARERAKAAQGKTVYINGFPVGSIVQDGRAWLTKEHTRPSAAKYRSREYIVNNSGTPFQALSPGANLYKVKETGESLYFSTTKPRGFDPTDPTTMDPSASGISETKDMLDLNEDEPSEFVVVEDNFEQFGMGKYSNGTTRKIETTMEYL